jgi:hypothetical protein
VSITKTLTIVCDNSKCGQWTSSPIDSTGQFHAREARRDASRGGWTYVDGKDYCRECSKKRKAQPKETS